MVQTPIYALTLSYRGGRYSGWQRQANALTVQQVVEEALSDLLRQETRIQGASRTDAGVHARGQVAHLQLQQPFPPSGLQHGTNQRLPEDVRVMAAQRMPDGFHARKCAAAKEYRYRLLRTRTLSPLDALFAVQAPSDVDWNLVVEATRSVVGHHDFSAFALAGGGHRQPFRRVYSAVWKAEADLVELRIVGDGFLRGMVRSLVGTLLEVGRARMTADSFGALLGGGDRGDAGPTAPARALVLQEVHYPPQWGYRAPRSDRAPVLD